MPRSDDTNIRINASVKPIRFLGTTREDLAQLPEAARRRAGHELFLVQTGREPADFKPMPSIGVGVCEIRIRVQPGAFRVIYVAAFAEAIYVLHVFRKTTAKTSRLDLELASRRLRSLGDR